MNLTNLVVYNASRRIHGPITAVDPGEVLNAILVTCYGGFLVGQAAAKRMVAAGKGTILFIGAPASIKGFPNSASFAMGKMGLTGLVQSIARELQPQNIHVAQVVIDAAFTNPRAMPKVSSPTVPTVDWILTPSPKPILTFTASTVAHGHLTVECGLTSPSKRAPPPSEALC